MPRTLARLSCGLAVAAALLWSVAVPVVASPGANNALADTPMSHYVHGLLSQALNRTIKMLRWR